MNTHPSALVICGPTASGKTSLAFLVASKLDKPTIISVDSRQTYKDLSIITGKDLPVEIPENLHLFGMDYLESDESVNIADFTLKVREIIIREQATGRQIILVGGSGLYLKSVTEDLKTIFVAPNPILREKLSLYSIEELQNTLKDLDPYKYESLNNSDLNNPRRLVRYIEIATSTSPVKDLPLLETNFVWAGLTPSLDSKGSAIRSRVLERLDQGAEEEVALLTEKFPDTSLPLYTALGVKDILQYQNGEVDYQEMIDQWSNHELAYAKRQKVWFQKQEQIIWYDESISREQLATVLTKIFASNAKNSSN